MVNGFKEKITDLDEQIQGIDSVLNKRITYSFSEIDSVKFQVEKLSDIARRFEILETKQQDVQMTVQNLKSSIPPSAEHMQADLASLNRNYNKYKSDQLARINGIKESLREQDVTENLRIMEDKLMLRQNDIIKALSKRLADRDETHKQIRLANSQTSKLYDIIKILFSSDEDMVLLKSELQHEMNQGISISDANQMIQRHYVHSNIVIQGVSHPNLNSSPTANLSDENTYRDHSPKIISGRYKSLQIKN